MKYPPVPYNDLLLRLVLCAVAAHIMTHYDESDSIWEALFTASYWRGFIASFIIALTILSIIRAVSRRLDSRFHWVYDTLVRTLMQFAFGVMIPSALTLLLVGIYFAIFGINILDTDYIKEDFIVACMMILTINVFYFGVSLYQQLRAVSQPESPHAPPLPAGAERVQQVDPSALSESEMVEARMPADLLEERQYSKVIIVNTSKRSIPVPVTDICYIYVWEGMVFLRTFDMQSMGDSLQLDRKLKDYEDMLDPEAFFRVNRQLIVNIRAVKDYRPFSPKTLELTLDPPPYNPKEPVPDSHKRLPVVAEDRVPPFRTWISR